MADGDVFVDLQEDVEPAEPQAGETDDLPAFEYDENSLNLVADFLLHPDGIEALSDISDQVIREHDLDWEGSEVYRQRCTDNWCLFAGELKPKEFPFKDAANCHVPILLKNVIRIVTRAYDELFGDWSAVFGVLPVSQNDRPQSELLSQHGNWQISEQLEDFPRQQMRGMLNFFLHGDVTFKSFHDTETKLNCHDMLTCDDFCTPYSQVTVKANYSDLPRYSEVLNLYRHQLEARREEWHDVDAVLGKGAPSWSDEPEQIWHEVSARVQGVEIPEADDSAPYKLIAYEGWLKLPNQERDRWCQAIVHKGSRAILRLTIHEQANWQDRERYERQAAELAAFRQAEQMYQQAVADFEQTQQLGLVATAAGMVPPMLAEAALNQPPPEPPMPPEWLLDPENPDAAPEPVKMEPLYLYSHGVCIEPLVGNLGLSPGRILADENRAANTALSQFTDQATLGNVKPIIHSDQIEFEDAVVTPGKTIKATGNVGDDIRKGIMPLDFGQANGQLLEVVKLMSSEATQAMQAPEVLSGEPGKSGETYRGLSARIEQATKQLATTTRIYARTPLKQVLRNNAYLNSQFLSDQEFFAVQDVEMGQPKELMVSRQMYERSYRIVFRSDLRFATQSQKVQEADELFQLPQVCPPLQMNIAYLWHAAKKALEARGQTDMIPTLGPKPDMPATPLGVPPPPPVPTGPPGVGPPGQGPPPGPPA